MIVMLDTCFCEYTSHGHCGVLCEHGVDNDATWKNLGSKPRLQLLQAKTSSPLPPRWMASVQAIRQALDAAGFKIRRLCRIRPSSPFSFYGPFREAAGSALKGDRKSY
ncbi:hypothetical protein ACLK1T_05375 [Escherichia coli]